MKRWTASGLILLLIVCLTAGCLSQREKEMIYPVYFLSAQVGQEEVLVPEQRSLPQGSDPVEGILELLLEGPAGENLTRTIPSGVTLRGWSLKNGLLTVDFSARYGTLSGIALTLADYSVVLTLSKLDEVQAVMITADGELLPYRDHQRLTAEDAWVVMGSEE